MGSDVENDCDPRMNYVEECLQRWSRNLAREGAFMPV